MTKRRKSSRFLVTEQVSVRFENGEFLEGTECHDISLGGMCIIIPHKIDTECKYGTVMLALAFNAEVILFESRFVRIWDGPVFVDRDDTRMGVKFIDIAGTNLENLKRIVALQSKNSDRN